MEFVIASNSGVHFASTTEMRLLFTYICDPHIEEYYYEIKDDYTYIHDFYENQLFVKIKNNKLIELSNQWQEIDKKNKKMLFIKKKGTSFIFENLKYNWKQAKKIESKFLNFDKSNLLETPNKIFNGGFHYITKENKNFNLVNKYYDEYKVITSDIKFKEDFTVNHSFFPKEWSIIMVKEKIIESLDRSVAERYIMVQDKVFCFYGYSKEGILIQTAINNKKEILTAYPIFRRIK